MCVGLDGGSTILEELELLVELGVAGDGDSHDNVRVSVEVLGDGVDDDVGAEGERVLEVGGEEGVVDDEDGARVPLDNGGEGLDVDEAEGWVGGGLDPDHLGVGPEGGLDVLEVGHVDEGGVEANGGGDAVEVAVGAAVDVVDGDEVVAGLEHVDDGGGGGRPRGKGQPVLPSLQRRNRLLKVLP